MPRGWKPVAYVLGTLALVALAYAPLVGAGHGGEDLALFVRASAGADAGAAAVEPVPFGSLSLEDVYRVDGTASLLSNLSLVAHARLLEGPGAEVSALVLRLEGVALLFAAACGLGLFLRRLLLPWTGSEHAAAAGLATVPLLAVHPLAPGLIGTLAGYDELLALALACWSAALFLKGRQDRRFGFTVAAAVLCGLAGLAGEIALFLPLVLVGAELYSSHRYRPLRERLRTGANTLLLFGLAACIDLFLRAGRTAEGLAPGIAASLRGFASSDGTAERLASAFEKIGVLVLPVNTLVTGLFGTVLAGAVLLLAMQPALVAARAAPRLWGWVLFLWFAALAGGLVVGLDARVTPTEHTHARVLVTGVAVMAAGLGLASTALSGWRRRFFPWTAATVYAVLALANGLPWRDVADEVEELRVDLAAARELYGADARFLVLDVPARTRGVDPFGDELSILVHPLVAGGSPPATSDAVIGLSVRAFLALTNEREFEAMRRDRVVVLFPRDALEPNPAEPVRSGGRRQAVRLSSPAAGEPKRTWRGDARSPDLELDPLKVSSLVVTTTAGADTTGGRRVHWRAASQALVPTGARDCVWLETGAEPLLVADLESSLAWRLGALIRLVWIEGGLTTVTQARLLEEPEALDVQPTIDGEHWLFQRPRTELVEATAQRGRFFVTLLSLADYELVELPVEVLGDAHLRVRGAAERVAAMGRPVAWTLDYRVEDVTLARARGRRVGRDGTVEE